MNKLKEILAFARRSPAEAVLLTALIGGMVLYGGSKPEKKSIKITSAETDAQTLRVKWESDDEHIKPGKTVFVIEARERPIIIGSTTVFKPTNTDWYEIGRTTDFELAQPGVWTDKTREIRVWTTVEIEGSEE